MRGAASAQPWMLTRPGGGTPRSAGRV